MYTHYPDSISSTLYPVMYRNTQPIADSLLVNVYIDTVNVGSFHAAPAGTSSGSPYFDIDVMGFCAANVAPFVREKSSLFGTLDDFYRSKSIDGDPVDCFKQLYVTSYGENISSAGYLVTSTAADTSSASYIIPADLYGTTYSFSSIQCRGYAFFDGYAGPAKYAINAKLFSDLLDGRNRQRGVYFLHSRRNVGSGDR